MKIRFLAIICALFTMISGGIVAMENPQVEVKTSEGNFTIELYAQKAPITVQNFLQYVDDDYYNGTIFHRVIDNFMIQGGGFTPDMDQKPTADPIKNEATNGVHNGVGTIAMARTNDVNSATSQFFINVSDNTFLDNRGIHPSEYGYCAFGKVTKGMGVVNKIKGVATTTRAGHSDVPQETVEILSISRVKKTAKS